MNWIALTPELSLLLTVLLFMAMACLRPNPGRDYSWAVFAAALTVILSLATMTAQGDFFHGVFRVDLFSQVFKFLLALGYFLVVVLCADLRGIAPRYHPEAYLLLAVSTLAMMLLVSSVHLATIFVSLELSSYALYILVYLRREPRRGMVAGLRYFLVGTSASAVMLFGMAMIYGVTGELQLDRLARVLPTMMHHPLVLSGVMLTLAGFFFKLAVFPFHFWAPDAYEGAANQVAGFIATVSKVAAAAILIRVVSLVQGNSDLLVKSLIVMAAISMTAGNLAAISQKDFKRLMAFSSIAHAGYLLIGILCLSPDGYGSAMFYASAVMIMKFTCFMVLIVVAGAGGNLKISDLAGLHRRSPLLALALMMALFGLAGIPPTVGFSGKLTLFLAAIEKGYLGLVLFAMANVVVSLYYYLLVLKAAYLDEPAVALPSITLSMPVRLMAYTMIAAIIGVGFYPTGWLDLVQSAVQILP